MVRPVDFQPNAIPICLPRNNDELVGRIGSVTGKFLNEPTAVLDRRPKFYGQSRRFKTYGYGYSKPGTLIADLADS